jgi:hypothetical protein
VAGGEQKRSRWSPSLSDTDEVNCDTPPVARSGSVENARVEVDSPRGERSVTRAVYALARCRTLPPQVVESEPERPPIESVGNHVIAADWMGLNVVKSELVQIGRVETRSTLLPEAAPKYGGRTGDGHRSSSTWADHALQVYTSRGPGGVPPKSAESTTSTGGSAVDDWVTDESDPSRVADSPALVLSTGGRGGVITNTTSLGCPTVCPPARCWAVSCHKRQSATPSRQGGTYTSAAVRSCRAAAGNPCRGTGVLCTAPSISNSSRCLEYDGATMIPGRTSEAPLVTEAATPADGVNHGLLRPFPASSCLAAGDA